MQLYPVYPLFDINIVKGEGCHVWDSEGQEYLDLYGGPSSASVIAIRIMSRNSPSN